MTKAHYIQTSKLSNVILKAKILLFQITIGIDDNSIYYFPLTSQMKMNVKHAKVSKEREIMLKLHNKIDHGTRILA